MKQNILVVYKSRSGNTESFVSYLKSIYPGSWFTFKNVNENLTNLESYDKILIGTYTWSNGRIPVDVKNFVIKNRDVLMTKKVLLFGSGITIYPKFCGALNNIGVILEKEDIPKIKFELTFIPEENVSNIETLDKFIKE